MQSGERVVPHGWAQAIVLSLASDLWASSAGAGATFVGKAGRERGLQLEGGRHNRGEFGDGAEAKDSTAELAPGSL